MEKVQIHHESNGIYADHHPDPAAQKITEQIFVGLERDGQAFQDFVDAAPNLNEEYEPILAKIKERFTEDGLDISPIAILDHEHYEEAGRVLSGRSTAQGTAGIGDAGYSSGRVVVDDDPGLNIKEVYGANRALGAVIHEAAHSTAQERRDIVSSKVIEQALGSTGVRDRVFSALGDVGGFGKVQHKEGRLDLVGNFWEEAFADLTRVRYSTELGIEPRLQRDVASSPPEKLTYISDSADPAKAPAGSTVLPERFAAAIQDDGIGDGLEIAVSTPSFAAYGLELLDTQVPGLFKEMQASRNDSTRQRGVIKMINNVRPGLYRELRDLPYTTEGFRKGLEAIQSALAVNQTDSAAHSQTT
jgi:hypothetical protein